MSKDALFVDSSLQRYDWVFCLKAAFWEKALFGSDSEGYPIPALVQTPKKWASSLSLPRTLPRSIPLSSGPLVPDKILDCAYFWLQKLRAAS